MESRNEVKNKITKTGVSQPKTTQMIFNLDIIKERTSLD
jgi:hypothetical protein